MVDILFQEGRNCRYKVVYVTRLCAT